MRSPERTTLERLLIQEIGMLRLELFLLERPHLRSHAAQDRVANRARLLAEDGRDMRNLETFWQTVCEAADLEESAAN